MSSPSEYSNVELLASLAKEEDAAFRILFDRYNSKVFSIAYQFLKSKT